VGPRDRISGFIRRERGMYTLTPHSYHFIPSATQRPSAGASVLILNFQGSRTVRKKFLFTHYPVLSSLGILL
jgi:hypothetical protein